MFDSSQVDFTPRVYFEDDVATMIEVFHLNYSVGSGLARSYMRRFPDGSYIQSVLQPFHHDDTLILEGREAADEQQKLSFLNILGRDKETVERLIREGDFSAVLIDLLLVGDPDLE